MKDLQQTQQTPQTLSVIIHPPSSITLGTVYDSSHLTLGVKCGIIVDAWRRCLWISVILLVIAVGIIIGVVRSANGGSSTASDSQPCDKYKQDDAASSVSLACFRYIWANAGCKTSVPDGYEGWYLRSPQGGKTIPCAENMDDAMCGAGSYAVLMNSVYRCDLAYRGR